MSHLLRRVRCLLGWHPCWQEFPPVKADLIFVLGRRTCPFCGRWERREAVLSLRGSSRWVRL